jgi:glycosyltransferase involved in cell wall biosynthesis
VDWASWWLQTPDLSVGWLPTALVAALRAVRRYGCDAIFSSAPPWTSHLIAALAKRITRVPWVADFRDPWRANPCRRIPYASVDRFDAWLEECTVHQADWVICNSETARREFTVRYPHLAGRFVTVPNGFDPEDFQHLTPHRPVGNDRLVITHAGVFYGPRRPDAIFQALRLLREEGSLKREPCLQLLGPGDCDGVPLYEIARRYGVEGQLLLPGEVPHRKALETMRGSDVLLLVGFDGEGASLQIPAKLFEYLGVGRPVLALAPQASAIADVIRQSRIRGEICNPDDPAQAAAAIRRISFDPSSSVCAPRPASETSSLALFHRRAQVGRIADLLTRSQERRNGSSRA